MTNINDSRNPEAMGLKSQVELSHERTAARADFGTAFKESLTKVGNAALTGVSTVAPWLPGRSVLTAAINGAAHLRSTAGTRTSHNVSALAGNSTALAESTGIPEGSGAAMGTGAVGTAAPAGGGDQWAMADHMQRNMVMNQMFNMRYLELQTQIQAENRQYTALSNVMKAKHDTAKNALNNIR